MYKFDFGSFKFGNSPDAGFARATLEWLADCDLIIHDTWFGEVKVLGSDIRNIHSPIGDLLTMPPEFQRKTLLCHYSDGPYEDDPPEPTQEIGEYRLLQQGRRCDLVVEGTPLAPDQWLAGRAGAR